MRRLLPSVCALALFLGTAGAAHAAPSITIHAPSRVAAGTTISITGQSAGSPKHTTAVLEWSKHGKWHVAWRMVLTRRHTFVLWWAAPDKAFVARLRVRLTRPGSQGRVSREVRLSVFLRSGPTTPPAVPPTPRAVPPTPPVLQPPTFPNAQGEFDLPSWTELPTLYAYNTTPSCPNNTVFPEALGECLFPVAAQPPSDPNNPERYLNSAYWPAEKRPDVEMYAVQRYGYNYENCEEAHGPHYCFLADALAVGYPVNRTPRVGDLWLSPSLQAMGWLPQPCSTSSYWWLGYVEQVLPDGSFVISGGGAGPEDSGLIVEGFNTAEAACSEFIHLFPPGSPSPK
jgi:hypothetical protein